MTCEDVDFCYRISQYGAIVSDISIKVQHLGEAPTIRVFLKKKSGGEGVISKGCLNTD